MTIRCSLENLFLGTYFSLSNARVLVGKPFQYNPDSSALYI
jgi:hypothetical protein